MKSYEKKSEITPENTKSNPKSNSAPADGDNTKAKPQHSKQSRVLSLRGIQTSVAPFLDIKSTGSLSHSHRMFNELWQIKSRTDFKFIPDLKIATRFYQIATIKAGMFQPLGYSDLDHYKLAQDAVEYEEQLAFIGFNHSLNRHSNDEDVFYDSVEGPFIGKNPSNDKYLFLAYCDKTLNSDQPDFRIVKGLLHIAIFHYYEYHHMYGERLNSEKKHHLQQLLLQLISKCTDDKMKGDAHFGLYLIANDPNDLEMARKLKCGAAIFHLAGEKFGLLLREKMRRQQKAKLASSPQDEKTASSEETASAFNEIINLIDEAANLGYGPACCLLGLGLLKTFKPKLEFDIEVILRKYWDYKILDEFSGNAEDLTSLVAQAIPFLKQKYAPLLKQTTKQSSGFNFGFFTRLFSTSSKENAVEELAVQLLKTAVGQESDITAIRALIVYYADKNDVTQTIEYLLKDSEHNNWYLNWLSFGRAFRDGGYLDLAKFRHNYVITESVGGFHTARIEWQNPTQSAPFGKMLNIKQDPEKAIFYLKEGFRLLLNQSPPDSLKRDFFELPLSFCHGHDPVNTRNCIPKDAKQAEVIFKIIAKWAKETRNQQMYTLVVDIFRNGLGCLPKLPEVANQLDAQYDAGVSLQKLQGLAR